MAIDLNLKSPLCLAVIFAGGCGIRMHSRSKPKQFLEYRNKPIIIYTLELFDQHPEIDGIVVACLQDWISVLEEQIQRYELHKVVKIIPGGSTGQESIFNALCAAEEYAACNEAIVLVHDGVRPLITKDVISNNIQAVKEFNNCITCVPAQETFIIDQGNGFVDIPDRNDVLLARAPQSFFLKDILSAHRKARSEDLAFIDCCTMMSHYGHKMHTVIGPTENIKITTPMDFFVFTALMEVDSNPQFSAL